MPIAPAMTGVSSIERSHGLEWISASATNVADGLDMGDVADRMVMPSKFSGPEEPGV